MSPNLITLVRVLLAFVSIALFRAGSFAGLAALLLLIVVLALDGVDGYVARRDGKTTDAGAAFDIAADRMVESIFWIYFASAGLITFWIPIIVIARGGFTDFLRTIAFSRGQTAFGEKTMMKTWWGRVVVGSRASRAAYGVVKSAAFFSLGLWLVLQKTPEWQTLITSQSFVLMSGIRAGSIALAVAAVAFCIVRGVPVMVEGARFFRDDLAMTKVW